jgi:hypothetical protein
VSAGPELAALLAPLVAACSTPEGADRLLRDLGVLTTPSAPAPLPEELTELAGAAQATIDAVLALDDPGVTAAERTLGLATALADLFDAVAALAAVDPADVAAMAPPFDIPGLWPLLAERVPGWLLVRWLRARHRQVFDPLALLGVVGEDRGAFVFDLDRLAEVAGDPGRALSDAVAADPGVLLAPLRRLFDGSGATTGTPELIIEGQSIALNHDAEPRRPGRLDLAVPAAPGLPGLTASAERVEAAAGPGLAITVEGLDRVPGGIELGNGWSVAVEGGAGVGGAVLGAGWAEPLDSTATLGSAAVELAGRPPVPWALLGDPGATRVELGALTLGLGGDSLTSAPAVAVEVGTDGLRLVIVPGDGDSFLASLLGGDIVVELALAGRWSPEDGLSVDGAAGLTVYVATSITLGPLTISGLTITLSVGGGVVALVITTEIGGAVGPVSASVHGMGLRVELLSGDASGPGIIRLGPVSLAFSFEPPDGACLNLELESVKGGGCLFFDRELGRYSGVIELELLGVGICAFIIIDTKALASGEWSMFFALFIDISAIQLGFGFALTGVGGLFGFNRVLDTAALEAGVRSGALDTVLFPPNPIDDAPEIIAELSALFPPSDGRYVFGPVVRLAWGTPPLIEGVLGIVLSMPDPTIVAVLGSVSAVLPTEDVGLVEIHLDVAGVLDAAAGTLSIDASLHDSAIVGFALAGDMAVRSSFLDQPSFLMAMGGFHPGFEEPVGFPILRRLSLGLSAAPVLDISFECYMAVTSNSVQFGSAFHLSAQIAGFGIEGGASFDALIEFSPFRLATRVGFYVAITAAGVDLAGIWLEASVEGPNPWLVVGTARFKILGFEEHVRIDEQIGGRTIEPAIDPADLLTELVAALSDEGAWSVVASTSPGVVVSGEPPPEDELVVLPDGILAVSQRAVPLGIELDKAGDAPLGAHDTFEVEPATGSLTSTGTVHDWFAPGYYFELAAGERLSSPSFERLESGIEFGGGEVIAGDPKPGTLDFEEILRDPELDEESVPLDVKHLDQDGRLELLTTMAGGGATGGYQIAADPDPVTLAASAFAVTHRNTGDVVFRAGGWSAAHQSDAGRRTATTVVPSWEAPP